MIKHKIIKPDSILQSYIQYFWLLEYDECVTNESPIRTFSDDSSGIIIEFEKQDKLPRRSMLYGLTTQPTVNHSNPPFCALGILFHPYAIRELFGVRATKLTDKKVELKEILGQQVVEKIWNESSRETQIKILSTFMAKRIASIKSRDNRLIKHCIRRIKTNNGMYTVGDLHAYYNITERQFQRKFQEVVGISPRLFLKLIRFKAAVRSLKGKNYQKISDVAYRLNYYDQAHFTRDFKKLSGMTPGSFRAQMGTTLANIIL